MFGYITINKEGLSQEAFARYQGFYCGLCRVLKARHGNGGRASLSYEMTFLALLLSALYEPEETKREGACIVHPVKKRTFLTSGVTDYAADMNLALAYHKLRDNWKDDRNIIGLAGSGLLSQSYRKVSIRYPETCAIIEDSLAKIDALEKNRHPRVDEGANLTGQMLGRVFVMNPDDIWASDLRTMGEALGRFIYVMDAYEDLPRDIRKKSYNPLIDMAKAEGYEDLIRDGLSLLIGECTEAFEVLPLVQDVDILRNILYSGVWARYGAIQKKRAEKESKE